MVVLRPRFVALLLSHRSRSQLSSSCRRRLSSAESSRGGDGGDGGAGDGDGGVPSELEARKDAYKQLENLDFATAAKILFTTPPKRKKFGFDFHLVQFFFACMPSLAVYLVAQYARSQMKRMDAELEEKKKKEKEEKKAQEIELKSIQEEESDQKLSKLIVRLDELENLMKQLVENKKKTNSKTIDPVESKSAETGPHKQERESGSVAKTSANSKK